VFQGVFNQNLQRNGQNLAANRILHIHLQFDLTCVSGLLKADIPIDKVDFLFNGYQIRILMLQDVAVDIGQLPDVGIGFGRVFVHQFGQGVQAVEQEMGIDLGLEVLVLVA